MNIKKTNANKGFTLIEVMIALAIFAVFVVSFMVAQGYNISDSSRMRNELKIKEFLTLKVNEIINKPPDLKESLTLKPETGKFEEDDNFKFEITYKQFKVPDYDKLKGNEEASDATDGIEKKIFDNVSKNLSTILWQVDIKVIDDASGNSVSMSTWLINKKAEVVLEAF